MGLQFFSTFARFFLLTLEFLIIGRVLMSFVDPGNRTALGRFLFVTTEPILAPVRSLLPRTGMFDLSPLIVLIVLGAIVRALV